MVSLSERSDVEYEVIVCVKVWDVLCVHVCTYTLHLCVCTCN